MTTFIRLRMHLVISPALDGLPRINSNDLKDLQGNLKDLSKINYEKLKRSLIREGFIFPLMVWRDPLSQTLYAFDGHQRLRLIQKEVPGGIDLPYILVDADDREDAKRKLLLFNSRYGEVTKDGWDEFIGDMGDSVEFVNDLTTFQGFLDENWNPIDADSGKDANANGSSDGSSPSGVSLSETFRLEVLCVGERDQQELFDELTDRGYSCKVLTL